MTNIHISVAGSYLSDHKKIAVDHWLEFKERSYSCLMLQILYQSVNAKVSKGKIQILKTRLDVTAQLFETGNCQNLRQTCYNLGQEGYQ